METAVCHRPSQGSRAEAGGGCGVGWGGGGGWCSRAAGAPRLTVASVVTLRGQGGGYLTLNSENQSPFALARLANSAPQTPASWLVPGSPASRSVPGSAGRTYRPVMQRTPFHLPAQSPAEVTPTALSTPAGFIGVAGFISLAGACPARAVPHSCTFCCSVAASSARQGQH